MFDRNVDRAIKEKCILVGICVGRTKMEEALEHLAELERLAETAEAVVVGRVMQKIPKIQSATLIGKGKLEEIQALCIEHEVSLVIFDEELSGSQTKNIEKVLENVKILDRSSLILDIFALHARTGESKIMVEIAQMQYTMPRLTNMWTHLCRQVGGIGTIGPGETQLEVDKRIVRKRITDLKNRLKVIENSREARAIKRNSAFHISIVGYTNAGKSTLTNCLTHAEVLVADKLFATLDSTTRELWLSPGNSALLSDTVGFIRKLPHHLVASFKSTLSIVREADLILHVVDASAPGYADQMSVTTEVLAELTDDEVQQAIVFNKCDRLNEEQKAELVELFPQAIFVSSTENIGIEFLRKELLRYKELWDDANRRNTEVLQQRKAERNKGTMATPASAGWADD
jgi:GTP-binding protein HflX